MNLSWTNHDRSKHCEDLSSFFSPNRGNEYISLDGEARIECRLGLLHSLSSEADIIRHRRQLCVPFVKSQEHQPRLHCLKLLADSLIQHILFIDSFPPHVSLGD